MKNYEVIYGRQTTITSLAKFRGELRDWQEVELTDASYFVGRLYGDTEREKKDGTIITTGFIIAKVDRGDYFIIKTVGLYYYIMYKDKKWKAGES